MTLRAQIDALPTWPPIDTDLSPSEFAIRLSHAALARLALLREWARHSHHHSCDAAVHYHAQCTCHSDRDALLAATEPPR